MAITVTKENLLAPSVEIVINGQIKAKGVSDNGATLSDLLNEVFEDIGETGRMVTPAADGSITLGTQVFIMRDNVVQGRTTNGAARVQAGDQVVVDRTHHNG